MKVPRTAVVEKWIDPWRMREQHVHRVLSGFQDFDFSGRLPAWRPVLHREPADWEEEWAGAFCRNGSEDASH